MHFYVFCGVILKSTEQARYLGVILSNNLSWEPHIPKLETRANQKLGFVKRNLRGCPNDLKRLAYISMVQSGLEYGSTVWGPYLVKDINQLQKVHCNDERPDGSPPTTTQGLVCVTDILRTLKLDPLEEFEDV